MICFRCLFGEEGKSKGEIDLFFFFFFYGGAAHVPSHNGLIIPAHRRGGEGTCGASARVAFQAEQTRVSSLLFTK